MGWAESRSCNVVVTVERVGSEAVRHHLKGRPRCRMADAFYENIRGREIALAHRDVEHQFRISFDHSP
jgi:hypothetical protein